MSFLARAVRQGSRRGFLVRGDHGHHAQEVVPKTYRNGFLFGEKVSEQALLWALTTGSV